MTDQRQLPGLTDDTRAFWTGGAEGRLMIHRCADCGHYTHPPMPACAACHGTAVAPTAVSGRGRLYSFTVNHHAWSPGMAVPYVVGAVELVEQARLLLLTNIVDCPIERLAIGMPVRVRFEPAGDVWLPLFEPAP